MRLAHTADIHIRSLSRHSEYKHILKSFVEDCAEQLVDHIFVGGDIFHTKTSGISPEYIDFLTWWLTEMSKVAQVHLVLGNHDGNLTNLSRQDAVTPIVEALNNPRVHLYKQSGVYNFSPGFNFCVFSCFDEPGWSLVTPVPGDINIATFHGPVGGSVTETGWDVDGNITSDFFSDYDFCFLGDIHKPQHLGYRAGKPWISYPGTPIQQNYAEDVNHGYLLWDISSKETWTVTTRSLPNPHPFVTVDWQGDLSSTMDLARNHPKKSRFRIRSRSQVTSDDIHRLSEFLRVEMSAIEVTCKLDYQVDRQTVKTDTTSLDKTDLRSPDVLVKLLKEYYGDDVTPEDVEKMTDHVKTYLSACRGDEDTARGSKWSLRRLQWDNVFSYGEGNYIEFDNLKGIVGIFGPNRIGKSSIVGTLMYSLFNTTDRGPMKNINICNVRRDYCSGRVIFDHNGTSYVLERQTVKSTNKKGVVNASTSLNLFRMREDGEMDDLNGEQRNDTEKTVKTLLGLPEDFLMTSLSAQGETNQFISQGSTKRRSILSRFLDLDVFDRLYDLSSKDATSVKSQLKNFPDRNWEDVESNSRKLHDSMQEKLFQLTDDLTDRQTTLNLLRQEATKNNSPTVTHEDVESQRRRVLDLERKSKNCSDNIQQLESEIVDLNAKLSSVQQIVDSIDVDILKSRLESQRKLESSIAELRHVFEREDTLLRQQKKSLSILEEVPCGDEYPTCKFIKDAHVAKRGLDAQSSKSRDALRTLEETQNVLAATREDGLADKISKYDKASALGDKLRLEISRKETEIIRLKTSCDACSESLIDARKKLVTLEEALNNEENEEVVSIRSKMKELSDDIRRLDAERISTASQLGKLKSDIEKFSEERRLREELLQSSRIHSLISNAFSKKGIPLLVTKSQLPLINSEVDKILQGIVDFTIELESDEETDTLEIYINYGDSRRIIELCSGMEKTISAIALRVAMVNISSLPKPDFFIIDEGFGTLDAAGVESCSRLLVSLRNYFKTVIVITHVDGIKDSADHIIEITKNEKDARIEWS